MQIVIFFLFSALLTLNTQSALVNGCIKYNIDANKQLVCIYCFYNMGLTSKNTCQVCKPGFVVVQGVCKQKPTVQTAVKTAGFETKQNLVLPSSILVPVSTTQNLQTAESSYFLKLSNSKKQVQNPISNTSTSVSLNLQATKPISQNNQQAKIQSNNLQTVKPTQAVRPEASVIKLKLTQNCQFYSPLGFCAKCKDGYNLNTQKQCDEIKLIKSQQQPKRKNCYVYQSLTKQCLQCKSGFQSNIQGICTQIKQISKQVPPPSPLNAPQITQAVDKVSNDIRQSFDPFKKYTTNQKDNQWVKTNNNDFSFGSFGSDFSDFGTNVEFQSNLNNQNTNSNAYDNIHTNTNISSNINTIPSTQAPQITKKSQADTKIQIKTTQGTKTQLKSNQAKNIQTPVKVQQKKDVVHKYPHFPYCFDYFENSCWACVPGYLLNLIINKCTPYQKPPPTIVSTAEKQTTNSKNSANDNIVLTAQSNCNTYNKQKDICEECYRNYYFNKERNLCLAVDQLCRTYDQQNGNCKSCYAKYTLNFGKCKKN